MLERSIFCPGCNKRITLLWDRMYEKSDVQKCEKCGLNLQIVNGDVMKCYPLGLRYNPETGEKEIIED
jgi:hypothetical protein